MIALSIPTADASDARADIGDVGELEQPLNRAVFAVGPVQHGKNHVERQAGDRRRRHVGAARRRAIDR